MMGGQDGEKRRRGDKETKGQGDGEWAMVRERGKGTGQKGWSLFEKTFLGLGGKRHFLAS